MALNAGAAVAVFAALSISCSLAQRPALWLGRRAFSLSFGFSARLLLGFSLLATVFVTASAYVFMAEGGNLRAAESMSGIFRLGAPLQVVALLALKAEASHERFAAIASAIVLGAGACFFVELEGLRAVSGCDYASYTIMRAKVTGEAAAPLFLAKYLLGASALAGLLCVRFEKERRVSNKTALLVALLGAASFLATRPFAADADGPVEFLTGMRAGAPRLPSPSLPEVSAPMPYDALVLRVLGEETSFDGEDVEDPGSFGALAAARVARIRWPFPRHERVQPVAILAGADQESAALRPWLRELRVRGIPVYAAAWVDAPHKSRTLGRLERGRYRWWRLDEAGLRESSAPTWGELTHDSIRHP